MPGHLAVFDILKDEAAPAADQALLTALRSADTATAQLITETLLVRNQRAGLFGLVGLFHQLDEVIRQQVLGNMDELFSVLRPASQAQAEQVRLNVLEIIHRGCAYRAAYLADALLHDRSASVREAAAETLHALADHLLSTSPVADEAIEHLTDEEIQLRMADLESYMEDRRQLVSAIESGMNAFNMHRQPRLVEAAMWFGDDLGQPFWSVVSAPGGRAARVAIGIMVVAKDPRLVAFDMIALSYAELRPHVVKLLGTCADRAFLAEWFRQSWRLAEPKAAKSLAALKKLACVEDRAADLLQWEAVALRHLPRCILATGLGAERKFDLIKELQRRGDERSQRAAAWALISQPGEPAAEALRKLMRGHNAQVARMSQLELARRRPLEYPPGELFPMAEGRAASRPAWGEEDEPPTFEAFWAAFDHLDPQESRRRGREAMAGDPKALAALTRQLGRSDPADRVRALRVITDLEIAGDFAEELFHASHDPDSEVRGTAMKALAQLPSAATQRILRNALADADVRVQANAVEALEESGGVTPTPDMLAKLHSPDNRVRANAAGALLKLGVREAAETLLHMLEDDDRAQRISAIWLIEHMNLSPLAARIVALAESDADTQVRQRAAELAKRLVHAGAAGEATAAAEPEVQPLTS